MSEAEAALLNYRLTAVENAVVKIGDAVETIAKSTAQIARLEERHAETREGLERAFTEIEAGQIKIEAIDHRVQTVEIAIPPLQETRGWIVRAVITVVGVVGMALLVMVLK